MNLGKSWKFFGELSPVLGENFLGKHRVLSYPWHVKVPHDRHDICCGSVTWKTSSLLQLLTPITSHIAPSAANSHWFCPHVSGCKRSKTSSKIIQIFFTLPFSAQLTHLLCSFFSRFPNQCCKRAGRCGAGAGLPAWMHQAFLKTFRSTHHWVIKNLNYHWLCIWERVIN